MKTSHLLIVVLIAAGAVAFYGFVRPSSQPSEAPRAAESAQAPAEAKPAAKLASLGTTAEPGSKHFQDEVWAHGMSAGDVWIRSGNSPLDANAIESRAEREAPGMLAEVLWAEGFFLGQLKARSS